MKSNYLFARLANTGRLVGSLSLLLLLFQCDRFDPNNQLSSQSDRQAAAQISIRLGPVGTLSKRQTIDLDRLILILTAPGEDTIRDTTTISGTGGSDVQSTIGNLAAPTTWTLNAATYDKSDSVIHSGSVDFSTVPAETAEVSLYLAARHSMLRVSFNGIPDSAISLSVAIDGAIKADSTLTVAMSLDTVVLAYDYLAATPSGSTHSFSLKARGSYSGIDTVLFTADTTFKVVSGENKIHAITLKWIGPDINHAPTFTSLSTDMHDSITAGSAYLDTIHIVDADGDAITKTLLVKPAEMTLNDSIIAWTPTASDTGTHAISVTANDGEGGLDTLSWTIRVKPAPVVNPPPMFSSIPANMRSLINVDSLYVDTVHATDPDNDPIVFVFKDSVAGMQLRDSIITWTPAGGDTGIKPVAVMVKDGNGGSDTLQWSIRVLPNVTLPTYPEIGYDTVVSGEINPKVEVDRYQFQGTAGDKISLRVFCGSTLVGTATIIDPANGVVATKSSSNYSQPILLDTIVLTMTGKHTIQIKSYNGNYSGDYVFSVYSWQMQLTEGPVAQFGQNYSTSLSARPEMDCYTFQGTAGDKISLRMFCGSTLVGTAVILDAANKVVATSSSSNYSQPVIIDTVTLATTGTHVIQIKSYNGTYSGDYVFSIYSWQMQLTEGPVAQFGQNYSTSLSVRPEMDCYTFQGTAGDKISLRMFCGSTLVGTAVILDAANKVVATSSSSNYSQPVIIDTVTLATTGTHVIQIKSYNGTYSGDYVFSLYSWQNQLNASPVAQFEQPYSDTIKVRSEMDCFLFQGTAGEIVSVRTQCGSTLVATVAILTSSNNVIATQSSSNYSQSILIDNITLPSTGIYLIQIKSYIGSYSGFYTTILTRN